MRKAARVLLTARVLLVLSVVVAAPAGATVISGEISGLIESTEPCTFGELFTFYSTAQDGESGWFYGSEALAPIESNVDVYDAGELDPRAVTHAERFDYTAGTLEVREGSTVFFRGVDGFYGAWVLHDFAIVPCVSNCAGRTDTVALDFTWYFQDRGTGNFRSRAPSLRAGNVVSELIAVPEPSTAMLCAFGLLLIARARFRLSRKTLARS